jgi:hypothetical protein
MRSTTFVSLLSVGFFSFLSDGRLVLIVYWIGSFGAFCVVTCGGGWTRIWSLGLVEVALFFIRIRHSFSLEVHGWAPSLDNCRLIGFFGLLTCAIGISSLRRHSTVHRLALSSSHPSEKA